MKTYCDDGIDRIIEAEEWSIEWVRVALAEMIAMIKALYDAWVFEELAEFLVIGVVELFTDRRIPPGSREFHAIWAALPGYDTDESLHKFKAEVMRNMEERRNG